MSAISSTSWSLAFLMMTGTSLSFRLVDALQRRSPAMSSSLPLTSRTMSGWMIPCWEMDSMRSSNISSVKCLRGCSGDGTTCSMDTFLTSFS